MTPGPTGLCITMAGAATAVDIDDATGLRRVFRAVVGVPLPSGAVAADAVSRLARVLEALAWDDVVEASADELLTRLAEDGDDELTDVAGDWERLRAAVLAAAHAGCALRFDPFRV